MVPTYDKKNSRPLSSRVLKFERRREIKQNEIKKQKKHILNKYPVEPAERYFHIFVEPAK